MYRYTDPTDSSKTLYVGQGPKRDYDHRSDRTSFGRRFNKRFPGVDLPQPIRWTVEVTDQLELNELETIAMFQFHSWRGYEGGMNLMLPGSTDYKNLGRFTMSLLTAEEKSARGRKAGAIGGLKGGPIAAALHQKNGTGIFGLTTEERQENAQKGGHVAGTQNKELKIGIFAPVMLGVGGRIGGKIGGRIQGRKYGQLGGTIGARITTCLRWRVRRGKDCICGKHQAA